MPFTQGQKIYPNAVGDRVGTFVGRRVALSGDGLTAFVASFDGSLSIDGPGDGTVWVFVLDDGTWVLEETLTGTGGAGERFGWALAASDDGNTLAVTNCPFGASTAGELFVFTRTAGVWSQQEHITGPTISFFGQSRGFGSDVDMSADGDTVAVGCPAEERDDVRVWRFDPGTETWDLFFEEVRNGGFVYVYVRTAGSWSLQAKLEPDDSGPFTGDDGTTAYGPEFGAAVSLSSDGGRLVAAGPLELNMVGDPDHATGSPGAFWVFGGPGGVWSQEGGKYPVPGDGLAGNHEGVTSGFRTVNLSGDGATLFVCCNHPTIAIYSFPAGFPTLEQTISTAEISGSSPYTHYVVGVALSENGAVALGALDTFTVPSLESPTPPEPDGAWEFALSGGAWLDPPDTVPIPDDIDGGSAAFGCSVAISADGTTALIGGAADNPYMGAAWIYGGVGGDGGGPVAVSLDSIQLG